MADIQTTPEAAEKAYAAATERSPAAKMVKAPPAPKAPPEPKVAPAPAKPVATRKLPVKAKPVAKAAPIKPALPPVKFKTTMPPATKLVQKDTKIMATNAKKTAEDFSSKIQDAVKDVQARAKTAFEKSQASLADANEFSKGNLEAIVESGKILGRGMQAMGKDYVAEVKSTFEAMQADAKEFSSVKSPKEFVELQSKLARKYFDGAVSANSKRAEASLKLATEAFQPLSTRVSLAVEKFKQAA